MKSLIAISIVLLALSVEWLSLLVLGMWTMGAAVWLVKQAGDRGY
jgi:hypothetical protein